MFDLIITTGLTIAILLLLGLGHWASRREAFSVRWLLVAAGLVVFNDAALTQIYGLLPDMFKSYTYNWQGKLLAIAITLAIAAHPAFGWKRCGLTFAQNTEGRKLTYGVATFVGLLFIGQALYFPNDSFGREDIMFQMTMPGLQEEPFYRGIFLLALNEAFRWRRQALGINLSWGVILTSSLFGLVHASGFEDGAFYFNWMTLAVTTWPAIAFVWLRERTGSIVLPLLFHNFGNTMLTLL